MTKIDTKLLIYKFTSLGHEILDWEVSIAPSENCGGSLSNFAIDLYTYDVFCFLFQLMSPEHEKRFSQFMNSVFYLIPNGNVSVCLVKF